jgi:hypothetical protein
MKLFDLVGSKCLRIDGLGYASFVGVIQKVMDDNYTICIIASYHNETPAWFVGDTISLKRYEFVDASELLFPTDIPGHTVLCRGNAFDDGKEHGTKITDLTRFNELITYLQNTVDIKNPSNIPTEIINFMNINNYSERFFLQGAKKIKKVFQKS